MQQHYMVQLENARAVFVGSEHANSVDEAVAYAREQLKLPDAKHLQTEVFQGQSLHEVIRG